MTLIFKHTCIANFGNGYFNSQKFKILLVQENTNILLEAVANNESVMHTLFLTTVVYYKFHNGLLFKF